MSQKEIRALIVDDSITIRKILKNNLAKFNIDTCDEASDGKIAWQLLLKYDYQLVLTDYNMPELNGLELAKKIFENKDRFAHIKVVAVSSAFSQELISQFKNYGVDKFIAKPFSLEIFKEVVSSIFTNEKSDVEASSLDMDAISNLFAKNEPKTSFDGKYLILDFGADKLTIDANAVLKAATIYTQEA